MLTTSFTCRRGLLLVALAVLTYVVAAWTTCASEPNQVWHWTNSPCSSMIVLCWQGSEACPGITQIPQYDTWANESYPKARKEGYTTAKPMERLCYIQYPCIYHPLKQQCVGNEQAPALHYTTMKASHNIKRAP